MKDHYDFSTAQRGKFFHPDMKLHVPIYLEEDIERNLTEIAKTRGVELTELVNRLLRQDVVDIMN